MKKLPALTLLATLLSLSALAPAAAATLFDNFKGTNASAYTEETRGAGGTFGTVVNSLALTNVDQIQLRWRPNANMAVTLFIYDSMLGGNFGSLNWSPIGNNLLLSKTINVSAINGAVDYHLVFDGLDFDFQANHRYDIGILGSTGSLTGSWDIESGCGSVNTSQGGFQSINRNANLNAGGSNAGYACVDPHIRLLSANNNRVPEPSALALVGLALAGLSLLRNKRT